MLQDNLRRATGADYRRENVRHSAAVNHIKQYLASIGARGGKAGTGKAKARTKAHARAAAKARWTKARALRQNADISDPES